MTMNNLAQWLESFKGKLLMCILSKSEDKFTEGTFYTIQELTQSGEFLVLDDLGEWREVALDNDDVKFIMEASGEDCNAG